MHQVRLYVHTTAYFVAEITDFCVKMFEKLYVQEIDFKIVQYAAMSHWDLLTCTVDMLSQAMLG